MKSQKTDAYVFNDSEYAFLSFSLSYATLFLSFTYDFL